MRGSCSLQPARTRASCTQDAANLHFSKFQSAVTKRDTLAKKRRPRSCRGRQPLLMATVKTQTSSLFGQSYRVLSYFHLKSLLKILDRTSPRGCRLQCGDTQAARRPRLSLRLEVHDGQCRRGVGLASASVNEACQRGLSCRLGRGFLPLCRGRHVLLPVVERRALSTSIPGVQGCFLRRFMSFCLLTLSAYKLPDLSAGLHWKLPTCQAF